MIKLWEQFLEKFKLEILVDKENGYIYLRSFLWYTDAKLPEDRQSELEQLLTKYLSEEEKGSIMRTVAQKYIEEGTQYGIQIGKAEAMKAVAKTMLIKNKPLDEIIEFTGLTKIQINKLK
ncbi:transposase [Candidatus Tisiphia endosymbiont of Ditula angustiorana]|uniref:transposase n=1 Tax=Candidatus Tisiphia endosymbiont of Ditula angustiorana TaxID=3066272 RepID=UPI00312CBD4F